MIDSKDLMQNNLVEIDNNSKGFKNRVVAVEQITVHPVSLQMGIVSNGEFTPMHQLNHIPLTEQILVEWFGFEPLKHFTITNPFTKSIGRNRRISVSMVGTPNEMIFLTEVDDEQNPNRVESVIVLRNYDYDGKTYAHNIQNLYRALTGTDLPILNHKK